MPQRHILQRLTLTVTDYDRVSVCSHGNHGWQSAPPLSFVMWTDPRRSVHIKNNQNHCVNHGVNSLLEWPTDWRTVVALSCLLCTTHFTALDPRTLTVSEQATFWHSDCESVTLFLSVLRSAVALSSSCHGMLALCLFACLQITTENM